MTKPLDRSEHADLIPRGQQLEVDIRHTLGDEWLSSRNAWLADREPRQLIGSGEKHPVRDLYHSILVSALS